jgi:DNA invertase Pin-like site-specific DNA recombinase
MIRLIHNTNTNPRTINIKYYPLWKNIPKEKHNNQMNKTIIYNRVSTTEQNPALQLKECESLANQLDLKDYEIIQEQKSAFKDNVEREGFEQVRRAIQNNSIQHLIVWDLDRIYRNRRKLIEFFELCKTFNCKIHSFRQSWFENLHKIPEPFNEIMFNLMLQIMGWLSEEESNKKSERIKLAVRKEEGEKTKSYKGNTWGRKSINSQRLLQKIKELKGQGLSLRQIQKHEEVYFYDKNKNQKKPSLTTIHNLLC